jgi:hypothetical protein
MSQHFFTGAAPTLKIGEGDKLFAYCWIDPANPPKTVMLQFNDGNWNHRAFWGEDTIAFGAGDTPEHRLMGPLPKAGEWVRLEVDAAHVGLPAGSRAERLGVYSIRRNCLLGSCRQRDEDSARQSIV